MDEKKVTKEKHKPGRAEKFGTVSKTVSIRVPIEKHAYYKKMFQSIADAEKNTI